MSSSISLSATAKKYQCIIFDCDGTLVDSETITIKTLISYVSEFAIDLSFEQAFEEFVGIEMDLAMDKLQKLTNTTLPSNFIAEFRRRMSQAFREDLKPIEGAKELLQQLNVPFCIASNGPHEKMRLSLTVTGLLPFFKNNIFSAFDIEAWKPSPDLFLHAARSFDVAPEHCLVVEDSQSGVKAAVAANMDVVVVGKESKRWRGHNKVIPINSLSQIRTEFPQLIS